VLILAVSVSGAEPRDGCKSLPFFCGLRVTPFWLCTLRLEGRVWDPPSLSRSMMSSSLSETFFCLFWLKLLFPLFLRGFLIILISLGTFCYLVL